MEATIIRKRADKSGARLPDGSWPLAGVELIHTSGTLPDPFTLPVRVVRRGIAEGWLTAVEPRQVERPSQADPDYDENGSAAVAGAHLFAAGTVEDPAPHKFLHLDALILQGVEGPVRLTVVRQPDKYVTGDDEARVTRDVYESGDTEVDHFYTLTVEA